jgi:branched-chain amino acid transport system ATP-binding protein
MSLLSTHGLCASYGDFQALFGIDLTVDAGETVAVIGANGAGKSTLLRAIVGLMTSAADQVRFDDEPIGALPAHAIVRRGIALVPEGRRLFRSLSVEENLRIGGDHARPGPWTLDRIYALFPRLAERRKSPATLLSGGEQQMVAIGRALMSNPRLLLCDELSLGLAPVVINEIYACLAQIARDGMTLLIVEQDLSRALSAADRFYCLQEGHVSLSGACGSTPVDRAALTAAYFGLDASAAAPAGAESAT